ncbi:SulP family sulfate permease [Plasticicumulans lactativorans]|uniref:SulP family sulfate permease n=1 Tax=Plasticicumulans lactativorans TaxID=1133106 RepID=A0A4R2L818_9GAMM|nr:SulP family inorganic anion transporter [Plasticicumulans lactativorans]TCO81487.1 SulP family sulfate permease [Plasticicumulans lactativorans]
MNGRRLLPFLNWPRPSVAGLLADAGAGIAVGLVLIPQALAYARLAGMPAPTGLYAALLPGIVGVLWGSSPLLAAGPVALTSLLTFGALQPFAVPGTVEWVGVAVWLALYAGLIQFGLGALRLGAIANLVSGPTITGFINAAALIIVASQLPALLGLPSGLDTSWPARTLTVLAERPLATAGSAAFGLGAVLLLFALRRYRPRQPGVLYVCVLGIVVSHYGGFAELGGSVVGPVGGGLPEFALPPALDFEQHRALLPAALIVALVSFTEAMSSARTLARKRGERWDEDQELIGQGLAKIASGLSGAFPVSGSFSRSALNLYAGARSGWSALFASLCVLLCLLWGMDYLQPLPQAVLAAVIIVPVLGLVDVAAMRRLWRISPDDGLVAAIAFAATLFSVPHLHWGVFAGFMASMIASLYRRSQPRIVELGMLPDGRLRERSRYGLGPIAPDLLAVRPDTAIVYVTAALIEDFILDRLHAGVRHVLLVGSAVNDLDATGLDMLLQLRANLAERGVTLYLCALKRPVWELLEHAGAADVFGRRQCFRTEREAITALRAGPARSDGHGA